MSAPLPLLAIVGATATGKTAVAVEVARRCGGEIISMDSRQIYRGMDVGTAKATVAQRAAVPHHGIDLVGPEDRFSAGRFGRYAREMVAEIESRGATPILAGGTGFFLRSLTNPIFREPELEPERRAALERYLADRDEAELKRWLAELDPDSAARLRDWGGRQRLLRALELPLLTGRPLTWWHRHAEPEAPPLHPLVFVLEAPRPLLVQRIDARVDAMVEAGLVEEVARLLGHGYDESAPGMNATGYIELLPYLRGERSLESSLDEIRLNTRAYARRQVTWLRHQLPAGAVRLDATRPVDELASEIVRTAADHGPRPTELT